MEDILEKNYAVVYLIAEQIYSEVPTSWLTDDQQQCWWPNSIHARPYMVRNEKPNKHQWQLYDVIVEGYSRTLEGARKRAENPEYTSTQEDLVLVGRGCRKKTKKHVSTDESSEDCSLPPSPKPSKCSASKKTDFSHGAVSTQEDVILLSQNNLEPNAVDDTNGYAILEDGNNAADGPTSATNIININEMPIHIEGHTTMQCLMRSIDQLKIICLENQKGINDIYNILRNMSLKEGEINVAQKNIFSNWLPLGDINQLKEFEEELSKSPDFKQSFTVYMKSVGGRDPKDNMNRCLGRSFSNNLGTQCSWLGLRGNFKVQNLRIIQIIIDTIMIRYNNLIQLSDVERNACEWFRLSKQRFQRENNKR